MGEARRRRLAREAGLTWKEDGAPNPAELSVDPAVKTEGLTSEGTPILVMVTGDEGDRLRDLARQVLIDRGQNRPFLLVTDRPRTTDDFIAKLPAEFFSAPLVEIAPANRRKCRRAR